MIKKILGKPKLLVHNHAKICYPFSHITRTHSIHTLLKKQPHEFYNCAIYKFEVSNESWLKIKLFDVYYSYPHKNKSSKSNPVIILMAIRWFKSTFNTESCKSSLNHDYFMQWVCQWFFLGCWRFQPIV